MDSAGEAGGSVCAPTYLLYRQKTKTTAPDSKCMARSCFHLFFLRCVRLYVALHSSGGRGSFFFQTQKSWILCFRSVRQSFAGNHANTGVVRHIPKQDGSSVYPCSAKDVNIRLHRLSFAILKSNTCIYWLTTGALI